MKEKSNEIVQSDPVVNIKKQVEGGVSFLYGKIFGSNKKTDQSEDISVSSDPSPAQFDKNIKLNKEIVYEDINSSR